MKIIKNKKMTPIKAIRKYCKQCTNGSLKEIKECLIANCPLYPYRMGKNPDRKGIGGRKKSKQNEIGYVESQDDKNVL